MVPLGLILLALTGIGPLMAWRRTSLQSLGRALKLPILLGLVAAPIFYAISVRHTGAVTAFCLPNAYQLLGRGLRLEQEHRLEGRRGSLLLGAMLLLCMLLLSISETRGVSEFLYFNF